MFTATQHDACLIELHSEETTLCSSRFLKSSLVADEKHLPSQSLKHRGEKYGLNFYLELKVKKA